LPVLRRAAAPITILESKLESIKVVKLSLEFVTSTLRRDRLVTEESLRAVKPLMKEIRAVEKELKGRTKR
jgi:hypothetical protein